MNISNIYYNDSSQCRNEATQEPKVKENKDYQIKVRITKSEKEKLLSYCEANDLTVSQFLRLAMSELLN